MKSSRFFLTLVAAGILGIAVPSLGAQDSANGSEQQGVTVPPGCQVVVEALKVQEAVNRFDSALAARDAQQLLASGIEPASVKGWQRFFKDNPLATVTDRCSDNDLSISGDTANWNCTETSTIVSEGKPLQFAHNIRFTFTRKNGAWTISDRR